MGFFLIQTLSPRETSKVRQLIGPDTEPKRSLAEMILISALPRLDAIQDSKHHFTAARFRRAVAAAEHLTKLNNVGLPITLQRPF